MRKISVVVLLMLILNVIICGYSYAAPNDVNVDASSFNMSSIFQADQEGTVEIEGHEKEIGTTQSMVGSIAGTIASPIIEIFGGASGVGSVLTEMGGFYRTESEYGADKDGNLKVSSIVFGEYLLLDPVITNTAKNLNPSIKATGLIALMDLVKELCASIFTVLRAAAIGLFIILILITTIRLAVSTTALDKAKFKALILDWLVGFFFSFFVKYVFIGLNILLSLFMDILWEARMALETSNHISFEFVFHGEIWQSISQTGGMQLVGYGILYIFLIWVTLKFLVKYVMRVFKVLFMVVISPVVGVIYTFNKAGEEGGSNAIKEWIVSYSTNLFIQPVHALIYLIFMFSASEIAMAAPILGIIFLWALERADKIIKAITGINDKVYVVGK